jgi:lipopolysaccharide/colanic/teichoic acid biosynthesis glycosyltransferase
MLRASGLFAKRVIDVVGAGAALAALSPVIGLAAAAIRVTMGKPAFFEHVRPGLDGKPFKLVKLRTMRAAKPGEVYFRTDAERITPLGRFLRRTSIDELPELWNVLRGDMSLVGPRPLLMEYLPKYTPEQARRHELRPGITGWAQVNGRQSIPFSRRLALDVWYVDHWSLMLDLKILAMTVRDVFARSGVIPGQSVDDVDDLGLAAPAAQEIRHDAS